MGGLFGSTPNLPPAIAPAPPVTTSNKEVVQAGQEAMQQEMMKKSIRKTIYAGDTGGAGAGGGAGTAINSNPQNKGPQL